MAAFLAWEGLSGRPFSQGSLWNLSWDVVAIAACAKSILMFRCLRERLVLGIVMVRLVVELAIRSMPNLFNSNAGSVREFVFALWTGALIVSLSMLVSSVRRPVEANPAEGHSMISFTPLLVLCAVVMAVLLIGALLYFVPLP
jgi:hypothetical protein